MNHEKIKSVLFIAAKEAGALMKSAILNRGDFEEKTDISIVTETDKACEKIILDHILGNFPDHSILSEESPAVEGSSSRWIIDPIDGTTSFAHTYPVSCVCIAYEEEGEVIMGGVYDPFKDEFFFAKKDEGAYLNDQKISVSKIKTIEHSLLATGFPYDRKKYADEYLAVIKDFLLISHGIRRTGSSAIDMCYVACGRFDAYWEIGLCPWDKAAAMLIAREAGGKTTDYSGNPATLEGKQNLVSNPHIHEEMIEKLKPYAHYGLAASW